MDRNRLLVLSILAASSLAYGCHGSNGDPPSAPGVTEAPPPAPTADTTSATVSDAPLPTTTTPADPPPVDKTTLSPKFVDYDVNHILSTGQSNSVANGGDPVLTTEQPYGNLMFDTGVMPVTSCDGDGCWAYQQPSSFVPLTEGDAFFDYAVETASSGIANQASLIAMSTFKLQKHNVLVSLAGRSGNTYWCLRKGSCDYHDPKMLSAFEQSMMDVTNAKKLADAQGLTYAVRAVTAIHGESDHHGYTVGTPEFPLDGTDGTPGAIKNYTDALLEWQRDYENSVKDITAQKVGVPMFISQLSGWNDTKTSALAQMQLDAHVKAPGKVILVTPGYFLSVREDCLHYDSEGERRLGEYFAKAYAQTIFNGNPWEPLRPSNVTIAGNVVTAKFVVPKAPLVIDTDRVSDPGNFGFEFVDDSGATPAITKIAVTGPDTVQITLASAPTGGNKMLRYAQNQQPNTCVGPGTFYPGGARGNLRDSDDTPSQYGDDLFNWSVAFEIAIK